MTSVLFPLALKAVSLISALTVMLQEQHQTGGDMESQALCSTGMDAPARNGTACQHHLWMKMQATTVDFDGFVMCLTKSGSLRHVLTNLSPNFC